MVSTSSIDQTVTVQGRFRGPNDSGNGGYVCGLAARLVEGPAEVTLRQPPPLDHPLSLGGLEDGVVQLCDDGTLIAEARPSDDPLEPPPPVSLEIARRVAPDPEALTEHPFPNCFVCGPARSDGLRIFPGEAGDGLIAAPWTPSAGLEDAEGGVAREFLWAALDCPSGWATAAVADPGTVSLLGRMTAVVHERPTLGHPTVLVADAIGRDGRKLFSRSALYTSSGHLLAVAKTTWITIPKRRTD